MGYSVKFNWVLQIHIPESLEGRRRHPFEKNENRVFPLDTPIDLIDPDRNAIAKIKIISFLNELDVTSGVFEIIKIYTGDEKAVLSNYWKENV